MEPDETGITKAQRITGELLWLSQKSRPDLSYGCSLLSSLTLKAPYRAIDVGMKMIRYLQGTKEWRMAFKKTTKTLTLYPDAAFAPDSAKSHTGWLITWGSNPIAWRSSRQSTVALSTAEAELTAILEGAIALLGIESLLVDLDEEIESKRVGSDSMSALTISAGNGSWRTRHLRLKAAWLQEKIGNSEVEGYHVPGLIQPADLLTKALPGQRIRDLLRLWSLVGEGLHEKEAAISSKGGVSQKKLVALLCCLMITMASGQPDREVVRIPIDWDMAGVCMILLMILGALMVWEGLKWGCVQIYHEYLPGATQRKLRRLQRIRDVTALAIQRELERMGDTPTPRTAPPGRAVAQPSTSGGLSFRTSTSESGCTRPHPAADDQSRSTPRAQSTTEVRTPPPTRRTQPWESPGIAESSGIDFSPKEEGQFEDDRVCNDVLLLLTVDHLREGLRHEGLMTSGLKNDLARRLADRLISLMSTKHGPTTRQLKYVLWLWRHGNVSGRYQLRWSDVNNRTRISNFIHAWKDR